MLRFNVAMRFVAKLKFMKLTWFSVFLNFMSTPLYKPVIYPRVTSHPTPSCSQRAWQRLGVLQNERRFFQDGVVVAEVKRLDYSVDQAASR